MINLSHLLPQDLIVATSFAGFQRAGPVMWATGAPAATSAAPVLGSDRGCSLDAPAGHTGSGRSLAPPEQPGPSRPGPGRAAARRLQRGAAAAGGGVPHRVPPAAPCPPRHSMSLLPLYVLPIVPRPPHCSMRPHRSMPPRRPAAGCPSRLPRSGAGLWARRRGPHR